VCGRFVSVTPMSAVVAAFDAQPEAAEHAPDYNVTPRRDVYVVLERVAADPEHHAARLVAAMRWGLIPSWAKDPSIGDRLINARAETVAEKPSFRSAFKRRRCIVPADGFYEWQVIPGAKTKQPMYIHRTDGQQLAFAGLWEQWQNPAAPDAPPLATCTIITTSANATLAPIHDRMPVILERGAWDGWLAPENADSEFLDALLVPASNDVLEAYPVGRAVSSPRNNGPELIEPVEPESLF
jgi:putative SOS response-associated peptidase YedK